MADTKQITRAFKGIVVLVVLGVLAPAFYYYGTAWARGAVEVEVEDVFPVGNKGTLEAKLVFPDGEVHRVLNRDQAFLFWKIDSEAIDNALSSAKRDRRRVKVWLSGVYIPILGDGSLFNHMNVIAVNASVPPGIVTAVAYAVLLALALVYLRRGARAVGSRARSLVGRGEAPSSE